MGSSVSCSGTLKSERARKCLPTRHIFEWLTSGREIFVELLYSIRPWWWWRKYRDGTKNTDWFCRRIVLRKLIRSSPFLIYSFFMPDRAINFAREIYSRDISSKWETTARASRSIINNVGSLTNRLCWDCVNIVPISGLFRSKIDFSLIPICINVWIVRFNYVYRKTYLKTEAQLRFN